MKHDLYKYESETEWMLRSGKPVSVLIRLQIQETISADGDECPSSCCEIETRATAPGMNNRYNPIIRTPQIVAGVKYPATIGRLVIPAEQLEQIDAALAAIHKSAEWQEKKQREAGAEEGNRRYEIRRQKMKQMMEP